MNLKNAIVCLLCSIIVPLSRAENPYRLSVSVSSDGALGVVLDHAVHLRYGCAYPLTYQLEIPRGTSGLSAEKRYSSRDSWQAIPARTSQDFFNAIEAARFDYGNGKAYASVAFSAGADSVFIRIVDSLSRPVDLLFDGICRLYDNRTAAVTASADDYSDWVSSGAPSSGFDMNAVLNVCRSYNLYTTVGVITDPKYTTRGSWTLLQRQLDSGFVEVASHSRNHLPTPYDSSAFSGFTSAVGEVMGSAQDIRANLTLPALYSVGGVKYIYTWIAPYGDYDAVVDSLTGTAGYLASRLYANLPAAGPREYVYGDSALADWDTHRDHFAPFNPSVELGAPSWGGGDTNVASLNGLFDAIAAKGDLYHFMWHPQVVAADVTKPYFRQHLGYVSNRKNIWYASLGHIYLYRLMQLANASTGVTAVARAGSAPSTIQLFQNYPNPFNPSTTILYSLQARTHVVLSVHNVLGQLVATLVNGSEDAGVHQVRFDGSILASGLYFYRLRAGDVVQTRKLLLLR